MARLTKSSKVWMILLSVVLAVLAVAVVGLSVKMIKDTPTENIGAMKFVVGALANDGSINADDDTKQNAYMKDLHKVDGLKITIEDEAPFTATVFYYAADKSFVSKAEVTNNTVTVPENAKYFRVMLSLKGAETFNVGVLGYIDDITITVNK